MIIVISLVIITLVILIMIIPTIIMITRIITKKLCDVGDVGLRVWAKRPSVEDALCVVTSVANGRVEEMATCAYPKL